MKKKSGITGGIFSAVIATAALSLTGCAAVYRGSAETIMVSTPNCPGALCTLRNKKGTWTITTPNAVTLPRSDDTISVTCDKGDQRVGYEIPSTMAGGAVIAETVLWGPFGLINAVTDGHREYPDQVQIPMVCK